MTDAEISRRLALAIGWKSGQVKFSPAETYVTVPAGPFKMKQVFDYRDPNVIWPIAERFDRFPWKTFFTEFGPWCCAINTDGEFVNADTAAKAVALAVIAAKEKA